MQKKSHGETTLHCSLKSKRGESTNAFALQENK